MLQQDHQVRTAVEHRVSSLRRPGTVVAVAALALLSLTGCSQVGDMTCEEYNAQGMVEQTETLRDLLSEHDLVEDDFGNVQGVTTAVGQLCASNSGATLDEATDWDSGTW